jgi:ribosome-associated protein
MINHEKNEMLIGWLEEKGVTDIEVIDVSSLTPMVDCFIIGTASNEKMCRAAAEYVIEQAKDACMPILNREGREEGKWILLDLGDTVLHIFLEKERELYSLETLWADGEFLKRRAENKTLPPG